jgi:hypothetical protein
MAEGGEKRIPSVVTLHSRTLAIAITHPAANAMPQSKNAKHDKTL